MPQNKPTNFELITKLNIVAGNPATSHWDDLEGQAKIIACEYKELCDHIEQRNWRKIRDDVCDLLVTVYGLGHRAGFPVNDDMVIVVDALFTRFDINEENAELTRQKYEALGIETYCIGTEYEGKPYFITRSSHDQTGTDDEFYPKDKFLKSHQYSKEVFPELSEDRVDRLDRTSK